MESKTKGAWIIHHGRKVAGDLNGAADYSTIDFAAKTASLLSRLAANDEAMLTSSQVIAAAKVGGLNPKLELEGCLASLENRKLIERSAGGTVAVLGVSGQSALTHAAGLFEDSGPSRLENAALDLGELASASPVTEAGAREYIGDTHKLTKQEAGDFLSQATQIGFVDAEGSGADRLLFNGNLFRRDSAIKTKKVLDSLSSAEQALVREVDAKLRSTGCLLASKVHTILGEDLFAKMKAAGVYDMNVVSNESGDHVFVTSPGSFHKFVDPMVDDAFDHAKALVAALSYGMNTSPEMRGRIWGVDLLLGKLLRGHEIGPAPAIGHDYRALELERVVGIRSTGGGYFKMRLLKKEVGQLALQVLRSGDANSAALEALPSAGMTGYRGPEESRTRFRKSQGQRSRTQTQSLLNAVRSGGGL